MTGTPPPVIVWFRDDLRLADHPALTEALSRRAPVIALYVLDEESPGVRALGGAARWWLHHSLTSLTSSLSDLDIPIVVARGAAGVEVGRIAAQADAGAVFWNRRYGAAERAVDAAIETSLTRSGIEVETFAAHLLFEPGGVLTQQGEPYSVFTPFWRACASRPSPRLPGGAPQRSVRPADLAGVGSLDVDDLGLLPTTPDWAEGLRAEWEPGEASAHRTLQSFLDDRVDTYAGDREIPSLPGTSRLSPHLRWGEISPHQVWHAAVRARQARAGRADGVQSFLNELGWREFAWHTLFHFPDLATRNWRTGFERFPWPPLRSDLLRAWQKGRTGVPLVDAGMRELWRTGWMHNRVRMVTASFLTKNLLIDWRVGERWFWDTLVDADAASNPFNWQWVAGSGADAAPYFRVFNPDLQASKFDAESRYIRRNIAEWGTDRYPDPIVDLRRSRSEALAAYDAMRAEMSLG